AAIARLFLDFSEKMSGAIVLKIETEGSRERLCALEREIVTGLEIPFGIETQGFPNDTRLKRRAGAGQFSVDRLVICADSLGIIQREIADLSGRLVKFRLLRLFGQPFLE